MGLAPWTTPGHISPGLGRVEHLDILTALGAGKAGLFLERLVWFCQNGLPLFDGVQLRVPKLSGENDLALFLEGEDVLGDGVAMDLGNG